MCHVFLAFASSNSEGESFHNFFFELFPKTLQDEIDCFPQHTIPGGWSLLYLQRLKSICIGVLQGLEALHESGWIHRDLSGRNILLDNLGSVKICDLGCACLFLEAPHCTIVGAANYRSPEQFFGDTNYGPAVDLWAGGAIFAEFGFRKKTFISAEKKTKSDQANFNAASVMLSILNTLGAPPLAFQQTHFSRQARLILKNQVSELQIVPNRISHKSSPLFSDFVSKFLTWDPSARCSAKNARKHDFLL